MASLSAKEILLDMRSSAGLARVFSGADFVQTLLNNDVWLQELAISFGIRDILDDREIAVRIGKDRQNRLRFIDANFKSCDQSCAKKQSRNCARMSENS